ncbi:MAG TPA: hypothetical protein VMY39_07340 [Planctomycetota bacterium]|nr:hypothetical protein [Planctomycetota bacterium]
MRDASEAVSDLTLAAGRVRALCEGSTEAFPLPLFAVLLHRGPTAPRTGPAGRADEHDHPSSQD